MGRAHKNCFGKQMQKVFKSIASFGIAFRVGREGIPFCPANLCPVQLLRRRVAPISVVTRSRPLGKWGKPSPPLRGARRVVGLRR